MQFFSVWSPLNVIHIVLGNSDQSDLTNLIKLRTLLSPITLQERPMPKQQMLLTDPHSSKLTPIHLNHLKALMTRMFNYLVLDPTSSPEETDNSVMVHTPENSQLTSQQILMMS